jgi:hypothetical protein
MKSSGIFVFSVPAILLTAGLVLTGLGEKEPWTNGKDKL